MTTTVKSMAYDHPAYTAIAQRDIGAISGSGGTGTKFAAFAAKILKSVILRVTTAGTSSDVQSLIQISGTTTTTYTLGTMGSGSPAANGTTSYNCAVANGGTNITVNQGDEYYFEKGTDATLALLGAIEEVVQPGAQVTE